MLHTQTHQQQQQQVPVNYRAYQRRRRAADVSDDAAESPGPLSGSAPAVPIGLQAAAHPPAAYDVPSSDPASPAMTPLQNELSATARGCTGPASTASTPTAPRAARPAQPVAWPSGIEVLRAIELLWNAAPREGPYLHEDSDVTAFHSSAAPPMTLAQYAHRVAYYTAYDIEGLCVGLALMRRYARATGTAPTRLMLHRLLLACVTVGAKTNFDHFLKNSVVAQFCGVALRELNWLEVQLLNALGFSAIPTADEVLAIVPALLASNGAWPLPARPTPYLAATGVLSASDAEEF